MGDAVSLVPARGDWEIAGVAVSRNRIAAMRKAGVPNSAVLAFTLVVSLFAPEFFSPRAALHVSRADANSA